MSPPEQDELRLEAYLDGELGVIDARDFELRLEQEPALARLLEARRALRIAMRSDLAEDVPDEELRERILERLEMGAAKAAPPRKNRWEWPSLAASFLLGAVLAGGLALGTLRQPSGDELAEQIVSAHIRGLMAPQATDVVSSDHHTVKPWFNGKIAFAPTVIDLGSDGFPLLGGRVDVIGLTPAATLVYSHGKHLISLTEMPRAGTSETPMIRLSEHGYLAMSWSGGGISYWAVSDTAPAELEDFVNRVRAASRS